MNVPDRGTQSLENITNKATEAPFFPPPTRPLLLPPLLLLLHTLKRKELSEKMDGGRLPFALLFPHSVWSLIPLTMDRLPLHTVDKAEDQQKNHSPGGRFITNSWEYFNGTSPVSQLMNISTTR